MTVIVVGAGPVGMTAALLLAQDGVEVVVLERHATPYALPRAVHLDDEIYRVLQRLGIAEAFAAISRPIPGMRLLDARHRAMAEFRRDAPIGYHGYPQANLFHQPELEALLRDRLAADPRIAVRRGCEVRGLVAHADRVAVELADGIVEGSAVLGCDGAHSVVRRAIGAELVDLGFRDRWLVIDVRGPAPLDVWGGVDQICDPARPATFMRVTGDRYRWELRMAAGESTAELTTPARLATLLRPWYPAGLPAGLEIVRAADYTFRAAIADRWRAGRVFVLGDAAHLTPPFIGQGMGMGLRDAANLTWKLAGVLRGALPESVLDTYEAERRAVTTKMIRKAVTVGWALTGGHSAAAALRRAVLAVLYRIPGISAKLLDPAMPPAPANELIARGGPCGAMLPQPQPGADARLGTGYAVVALDDAAGAVNVAADAALARWLRAHRVRAVLVRPDRVVAAYARRRTGIAALVAAGSMA